MKNRLSDLTNHLFAQMERLSDEDISPEQLETEVKRADALANVAEQIVRVNALSIQAAKLAVDYGTDPAPYLVPYAKQIESEKP